MPTAPTLRALRWEHRRRARRQFDTVCAGTRPRPQGVPDPTHGKSPPATEQAGGGQASGGIHNLGLEAATGKCAPPSAQSNDRHRSRRKTRATADARHSGYDTAPTPDKGSAARIRSSRRRQGQSAQVTARGVDCRAPVPSGHDDAADDPLQVTLDSAVLEQPREAPDHGRVAQRWDNSAADFQRRDELKGRPTS